MSKNTWAQVLSRSRKSGTALSNTLTATSIIPAAERFNCPSNVWEVGDLFHLKIAGKISTASSSPGNLSLDLRVGSVIVAAFTTPTLQTSQSNVGWIAEFDVVCQSVDAGTGTTLMAAMEFRSAAVSGIYIPTPVVGTGFDNTISGYFDNFGTWSVASASNSLQWLYHRLKYLN